AAWIRPLPRGSVYAPPVGLEAQWTRIAESLPKDWEGVDLRLSVRDPSDLERASRLLGPLTPGRVRGDLRLSISRTSGVGPEAARRLFARLDEEGIDGRLTLAGRLERSGPRVQTERSLAAQGDCL